MLAMANRFSERLLLMRNLIANDGTMPFDSSVRFLVEESLIIAC